MRKRIPFLAPKWRPHTSEIDDPYNTFSSFPVKKEVLKKNTKKGLKEEREPHKENRPLGCGPLKEQENKTSEHQNKWIKHALTCQGTVADFR